MNLKWEIVYRGQRTSGISTKQLRKLKKNNKLKELYFYHSHIPRSFDLFLPSNVVLTKLVKLDIREYSPQSPKLNLYNLVKVLEIYGRNFKHLVLYGGNDSWKESTGRGFITKLSHQVEYFETGDFKRDK